MAKKVEGFSCEMVLDNYKKPLMKTQTKLEGGEVIDKIMTIEDLGTLFKYGLREEKVAFYNIPSVPTNFYRGGISRDSDTFWVSLTVPARRHQYICDLTGEIFNLPYPSLLFVLLVKKGRADGHVFCYTDNEVTEQTKLYHYPYGHVSSDGHICMGSCSANIPSIERSNDYVDSFFNGRDAGHYYTPGMMARPHVPLRELVGMVMEKGEFPSSWLLPIEGSHATVGECLKTIIELKC
jgi:hypothetical protein